MKRKNLVFVSILILSGLVMSLYWSAPRAEAARLTSMSNTLSSSAPATDSRHTIKFTNPTAIPASGTIAVTVPTGFTIDAGLNVDEISFEVGSSGSYYTRTLDDSGVGCDPASEDCVGISGQVVTFTLGTTSSNAACDSVAGGTGNITAGCDIRITLDTQTTPSLIENPAKVATAGTADIYTMAIETKTNIPSALDSGDLKIAIQDQTDVEAITSSRLSFVVEGTSIGDVTTTATAISFEDLIAGTSMDGVQKLIVATDARHGFTVTLQRGTTKLNEGTYDIDDFTGTNASPTSWSSPSGTSPGVDTGWIGYKTSDAVLGTGTPGRFASGTVYAGLATTAYEVFYHSGPANGTASAEGEGYAHITYQIETNILQPTGYYTGLVLTYNITAIF